jgi:hypothetical protein
MREIKITYDFKKLKGKPKRLLESLGYKIKSYGVQTDTVTLVFLLEDENLKIQNQLKEMGVLIDFIR